MAIIRNSHQFCPFLVGIQRHFINRSRVSRERGDNTDIIRSDTEEFLKHFTGTVCGDETDLGVDLAEIEIHEACQRGGTAYTNDIDMVCLVDGTGCTVKVLLGNIGEGLLDHVHVSAHGRLKKIGPLKTWLCHLHSLR